MAQTYINNVRVTTDEELDSLLSSLYLLEKSAIPSKEGLNHLNEIKKIYRKIGYPGEKAA